MRKFKEKGVTLLELLIVIVLISVMAAILYPNFSSNARKAKRSVALKSVQEVSNRLEKYMTYCNAYTTEFGGNISADSSGDKCTGLGMSVTNTTTLLSDLDVYNINIELDDCKSQLRLLAHNNRILHAKALHYHRLAQKHQLIAVRISPPGSAGLDLKTGNTD